MQTLSSKEFFEQVSSNSLKTPLFVKGIARKGEKTTEILFKKKEEHSDWVTIPSSMVEEVKLIKTFKKEDETWALVKLLLKAPTTPEGKVLTELLASSNKGEKDEKSRWEGGHGWEGFRHGCKGEGHNDSHSCLCGHGYMNKNFGGCNNKSHYCSCGCHHTDNCGCGCKGM